MYIRMNNYVANYLRDIIARQFINCDSYQIAKLFEEYIYSLLIVILELAQPAWLHEPAHISLLKTMLVEGFGGGSPCQHAYTDVIGMC